MKSEKNYFADSTFLIDLAKGVKEAKSIRKKAKIISTSKLCVYELAKFSELDLDKVDENKTEHLELGDIRKAGDIYRELRRRGEMINQIDILIASQAIKRDKKLLTADSDFKKIEDVETRFYREI
ncbi:MAG: PIN domain nuclease [Nanohaloarchaea archaeon QH_8_44_6]|nr:MAG: PIN domain nuclease [Nanohaloarchaea archaeon QH_8_44_6]